MRSRLFILGSVFLVLVSLIPGLVAAQSPRSQAPMGTAFTYQGRLNAGGSPAEGLFDFEFRLYDAAEGGALVGGPINQVDVPVSRGLFTVSLDFGPVFTGQAAWLEVAVKGPGDPAFTTLAPRQPLMPTPYALHANHAADANTAGELKTEVGGIRLEPGGVYSGGPSVIGGFTMNHAIPGSYGATIGGGGGQLKLPPDVGYWINTAGNYATVGGGADNHAEGENSTVGGGLHNAASQMWSTVGGGISNVASNQGATVAGGGRNTAEGGFAFVGGGNGNHASDWHSTVSGGEENLASADHATVAGGLQNTASGQAATVPGGEANLAQGDYSFAAGSNAKALHEGAFVWADATGGNIASAGPNQFLVRASGGVVFTTTVGSMLRMYSEGMGPGMEFSANIIGGYSGNSVAVPVVGATISGGGGTCYGCWSSGPNRVTANFGTVGGGLGNQAGGSSDYSSDAAATVAGGAHNTASGYHSAIGGGGGNESRGDNSTVAGGSTNLAAGLNASIGGGFYNIAGSATDPMSGWYATIGGGAGNRATADYATIAGGGNYDANLGNRVTDSFGTVSGGSNNQAGDGAGTAEDRSYATVGGGNSNRASGEAAVIGGGKENAASARFTTVGGGVSNTATFQFATIGGGWSNTASGDGSLVAGGVGNRALGLNATVAGGNDNRAGGEIATVAGGRANNASTYAATIGGGASNQATGERTTVGGGTGNNANAYAATIAGGMNNIASATRATVGGGQGNTASGPYATVPGGDTNTAQGSYSLAAGRRAKALNTGCFVWGDSTDADITCSANNAWFARATGGVYFYTNASLTSGVRVLAGASAWSSVSDRKLKENFAIADGQAVLERLSKVPITTWNYKAQDDTIRHMGPVAQDFYAAFGLGEDERLISTIDADGVALAAIQGLYTMAKGQASRIQQLETENADLKQQMSELQTRLANLEAIVSQMTQQRAGGQQ